MDRANEWLKRNPDVHVTTAETVTWMNAKENLPADTEQVVLSKSVAENTNTYYRRGLRWVPFTYHTNKS